jgi:hypothetical protein
VSCAQTSGAARVGGPCVSAVGGGDDIRIEAGAEDGERLGADMVDVVDVTGEGCVCVMLGATLTISLLPMLQNSM